MRPSSSLSRPSTSQSHHRPASRISQASGSRLSHRPPSRHAQRLAAETSTLVTQLTGLCAEEDPEDHYEACDSAGRTLEAQRYTGLVADIREVDAKLNGLSSTSPLRIFSVSQRHCSDSLKGLRFKVMMHWPTPYWRPVKG